ncbi:uncharacterized protein [Onthophagus taurus]|uniref:uncharacterized protein isoform X2 n=1 Tax=Onthophagus taurus TaxID=166361 RepID=UPI0039BE4CEF
MNISSVIIHLKWPTKVVNKIRVIFNYFIYTLLEKRRIKRSVGPTKINIPLQRRNRRNIQPAQIAQINEPQVNFEMKEPGMLRFLNIVMDKIVRFFGAGRKKRGANPTRDTRFDQPYYEFKLPPIRKTRAASAATKEAQMTKVVNEFMRSYGKPQDGQRKMKPQIGRAVPRAKQSGVSAKNKAKASPQRKPQSARSVPGTNPGVNAQNKAKARPRTKPQSARAVPRTNQSGVNVQNKAKASPQTKPQSARAVPRANQLSQNKAKASPQTKSVPNKRISTSVQRPNEHSSKNANRPPALNARRIPQGYVVNARNGDQKMLPSEMGHALLWHDIGHIIDEKHGYERPHYHNGHYHPAHYHNDHHYHH